MVSECSAIRSRFAKQFSSTLPLSSLARVVSRRGAITTHVTITDIVPPGVCFMTFHYKESPVNELTNSAYDPVTKTVEFKVCAVRVEKLGGA